MSNSLTYPVTLGTYSQTLGEVTEKTIGPAILLFPLLQFGSLSTSQNILLALSLSFATFGMATALTQFTLIYAKSKREDNSEHKEDTLIIRALCNFPHTINFMTTFAAIAEGITAAAAIVRFGLKATISPVGKLFNDKFDYFLMILFAVGAFYSRYKKINYVDAQEARNEYERPDIEKKPTYWSYF